MRWIRPVLHQRAGLWVTLEEIAGGDGAVSADCGRRAHGDTVRLRARKCRPRFMVASVRCDIDSSFLQMRPCVWVSVCACVLA